MPNPADEELAKKAAADAAAADPAQIKIDALFQKVKVSELFNEAFLKNIRNGLVEQLKKHPSPEHFLSDIEKSFGERRQAEEQLKHQRNRLNQITKMQIDHPSTLDVEKLLPHLRAGTLGQVGAHLGSFVGKEYPEIMAQDGPEVLAAPPTMGYINAVRDAKSRADSDIRLCNAQIYSLMNRGSGLSDKERNAFKRRNRIFEGVKNSAELLGSGVKKTVDFAGKGMWSHSKASEDSRAQKYYDLRNKLLSDVMMKIGPGMKDSTFYLRALNRMNEQFGISGDGILDHETFVRMQKFIADEIEKEGKVNSKEMEEFNKKLQDLERDMLAGLQKHVDKEDAMWKGRLLQIFLLLTPLGAFSHIFDYMDPLLEWLGPFFDGSLSLGEGLGKVAASDVLNIGDPIFGDNFVGDIFNFGEHIHDAHIDEAIAYLVDNTPFIKEITETFNFLTDNEIFQEAVGLISPIFGSPLVTIGIAVLYSGSRAKGEIDHRESVEKFKKESNEALEKAIDKCVADLDSNTTGKPLEERVSKVAEGELKIKKDINLFGELAKFVADVAKKKDGREAIFDKLKFETKDSSGADIAKSFGDLDFSDEAKVLEFLLKNEEFTKNCMKEFLLFSAVQKDGATITDNVAKHKEQRSDAEKEKLCNERQKKIDKEFVVKLAGKENVNIAGNKDNPEEEYLKRKSKYLYRMADGRVPDPTPKSKVVKPAATGLYGAGSAISLTA
jgi:hypothetical protein